MGRNITIALPFMGRNITIALPFMGRNITIALPFRGRGRVGVGLNRFLFNYGPINRRSST
jgi:hypothetical protein